ncbi:hypothetical protein A3C98_05120 [Candidatus Roizmanbacteria bacterium RIFCSPHIGHO2_02_FULL_37_15]|nr:MAG: hypothetical protein A2859_06030 [Candidatus Roizmanbacteria bacterium RIFCSPHIGHO2_01_FULL_37_16b]OGK20870.1 MAG: hypothetical protein A3C98_05120 [Candidatus Roizmanbacteria bacterium RIFCSPHIGHO2_02_FULL_37_15]OGK32080.1 MAG: hypothetical protein A3F57_04815 [Candidatus Roizmanbacteria bacterium RIFCSPHIGHO2_12_FULL_36_11]
MYSRTSITLSTTAGRGQEVDIPPAPRSFLTGKEAIYLTTEIVLLSAAVAACAPSQIPPSNETPIPPTSTPNLPDPKIGVTKTAEATPQPTSTSPPEENSFGLNGDSNEWPGTGINHVELVNSLLDQGIPVSPSREMTVEERENLEKAGAKISELEVELRQRLTGSDSLELVISETGGWAFEIRAADGRLKWSLITDENGNLKWANHPDQIPAEPKKVEFKKIDAQLESGETIELFVHEGIAAGIVINPDGQITGVFNPLTGEIVRNIQAVEPTPAATPDELQGISIEEASTAITNFFAEAKTEFEDVSGPEFFVDRNGRELGLSYYDEIPMNPVDTEQFLSINATAQFKGFITDGLYNYGIFAAIDKNGEPFIWIGGIGYNDDAHSRLGNVDFFKQVEVDHPVTEFKGRGDSTLNTEDALKILPKLINRPLWIQTGAIVADDPEKPFLRRFTLDEYNIFRRLNDIGQVEALKRAYNGDKTNLPWYIITSEEELDKLETLGEPFFIFMLSYAGD